MTRSQTKEKKSDKGPTPERMKDRRDRDRPTPHLYRFHEYHPLKATVEEVFMQTGDKEIFCRPMYQKKDLARKNHRSTGHNMDDCLDLKKEVESLIQRGHLQEFMAEPGETNQPIPSNLTNKD